MWLTTRLDYVINWARRNSLWIMPFNTACCGIEFMAAAASRYDFARFGMERLAFTPRQAERSSPSVGLRSTAQVWDGPANAAEFLRNTF